MVGAFKPMVSTPGSRRLKPLFLGSFSKVCGLLLVTVNLFHLPLPPWGCSVWCTNAIALSMGQLPFQIKQPCTHNGFALWSLPFGVM